MRGGPVQCTVIVATTRIGSPEVSFADSLLLMDQASAPKFASRVRPEGLVVVNSTLVNACTPPDGVEVLSLPATEAAETLGDQRVANVIMLGAFLTRRPVIQSDTLIAVMRTLAGGNAKLLDVNLRALDRGTELARP
jgi:2-oxoglutarate ferredoxin oxidoreductase subunit gamma